MTQNNLTGDMPSIIGELKKTFDDLKNTLQNALTPTNNEERKKREAQELFRIKRAAGEGGAAEPEPKPEKDEYYCIKKAMGENTVKSCLPKVNP